MVYRVASHDEPSARWQWESRVIASLEVLVRVLWMYRSMPQSSLRVFFASSVDDLDLMLDRETQGLASTSLPVDQFLQGSWRTNQSLSQLELRQFESALSTHTRVGMGDTATGGEPSLQEQRCSPSPAARREVLDSRRLEVECGTPGDQDTLYTFTLPAALPQLRAWMALLVKVQEGTFQP